MPGDILTHAVKFQFFQWPFAANLLILQVAPILPPSFHTNQGKSGGLEEVPVQALKLDKLTNITYCSLSFLLRLISNLRAFESYNRCVVAAGPPCGRHRNRRRFCRDLFGHVGQTSHDIHCPKDSFLKCSIWAWMTGTCFSSSTASRLRMLCLRQPCFVQVSFDLPRS